MRELGIADELADRFTDKFPTVRLTQKTVNALRRVVGMSDESTRPADAAVLTDILSELTTDGAAEAARLISVFGSMLGVVAAIERSDERLELPAGIAMRIELLCSIYLSKVRAVTVRTRSQAMLYLGELLCADENETTALLLDEKFTALDAISVGADRILDADAANKLDADGAAYVILSRKTPALDDRFFDLAESVKKLSAELAAKNVTVADFLIFTPQGNAHLTNAKIAPRFEFAPFELPYYGF